MDKDKMIEKLQGRDEVVQDEAAEAVTCETRQSVNARAEEETFERGCQIAMEQEEAEDRQQAREIAQEQLDSLTYMKKGQGRIQATGLRFNTKNR